MGRPRTITDDAILQAAREVFLELGPGASTAAIAERMGVSQASLFKRFGTKEELLIAALQPPPPTWQQRVAAGPDERPIQEQLLELALEISAFMEQLIPRITMLRAAGIDVEQMMHDRHRRPPPVKNFQLLVSWFEAAIAVGRIRAGNAEIYAITLLGSINTSALFEHLAGQPIVAADRETFGTELVNTLWRALDPAG